jgi:hypothetical protein
MNQITNDFKDLDGCTVDDLADDTNNCLEKSQKVFDSICPAASKVQECFKPMYSCMNETMQREWKENPLNSICASKMPKNTPECRKTFKETWKNCKKQQETLNKTMNQLPQDFKDCSEKSDNKSDSFKFCTPDQKKAGLEMICPAFNKYEECMKPAVSCLDERTTRLHEEDMKEYNSECAPYIKSNSQGLSSMIPWTLFLLLFV